jgi:hypothetical protein
LAGFPALAAAAVTTTLLLAVLVLGIDPSAMRVPFRYGGDALLHAGYVKTVIDQGWYLNNPDLGAPGGLALQAQRPVVVRNGGGFTELQIVETGRGRDTRVPAPSRYAPTVARPRSSVDVG